MKKLINWNPGYKVQITIEEDADIQQLLNNNDSILFEAVHEYLREYVMSEAKKIIGGKPQGYFDHPEDISTELYNCFDEIVHSNIDNELKLVEEHDERPTTYTNISLPSKLYELGRNCEVSAIETGETILLRLKEFLQRGVWQFGFRKNGIIINDISHFPKKNDNITTPWIDNEGNAYEPVIWFGLSDEKPSEVWTLSKHRQEDWRSFWFNDFWHLDWNALFGGYDNYYTVWMFSECGMEEPVMDFDRIKKICPISLDEEDSDERLTQKIECYVDALFLNGEWSVTSNELTESEFIKKKTSLVQSLEKAGYAIGKVYINANSDNEDAPKLPDGRIDPIWLDDGSIGDQMSHSMNEIEDYLALDKTLFPQDYTYNSEQGKSPLWDDVLDKYLEYDEIEDALYDGWEQLLIDKYGNNWRNNYQAK